MRFTRWRQAMKTLHERTFRKVVISGLVFSWSVIGLLGCWGGDIPSDTQDSNPASSAPLSLSIATTTLPAATEGQAYLTTLSGVGGAVPYTWLVTPPLPAGLTLDSA